jgi:hypothetical protein
MPDTRTYTQPQPACLLQLVADQLREHLPIHSATPSQARCRACNDPWPCAALNVAQSINPATAPAPRPAQQPAAPQGQPPAPQPDRGANPALRSWWSHGTAVGTASVPPPVSIAWQHGVSNDGADVYTAIPIWDGQR